MQGLSAGAGIVVGRAMVLDRLDGAQAQKMLSDVTVVFALAPAIAPILGGWLQVWFGWRAVFVFLALAGLLLGLVCRRALPESLPAAERQAFHYRRILANYWMALRHPRRLLLAGYLLVAAAVAPLVGDSALGLALFTAACTAGSLACMLVLSCLPRPAPAQEVIVRWGGAPVQCIKVSGAAVSSGSPKRLASLPFCARK
ncbi:MAG TPA: MFS transporter [Noviherbaspirillum sp.]|nr:MFS transporter [Noviherbaspirillum sp.]